MVISVDKHSTEGNVSLNISHLKKNKKPKKNRSRWDRKRTKAIKSSPKLPKAEIAEKRIRFFF